MNLKEHVKKLKKSSLHNGGNQSSFITLFHEHEMF